jgi:hypothetical protein
VRILSISDHEGVRLSRELLLKMAGYGVISAASESVLSGEMHDDGQLVLIGQTVEGRVAGRVISAVRKARPHVRIMRIRRQSEGADAACDGSCFVEDGPATFLRCVSDLLK